MTIEPGLLPLMRGFMASMFFLLGLGMCGQFSAPQRDYFNILMWAMSGGLMLALWRRQDYARFRAVLLSAAWMPLFGEALANLLYHSTGGTPNDPNRLYIWLIFVLLVISAQYGMRAMCGYVLVSTALPLALAWWIVPDKDYLAAQGLTSVVRLFLLGFAGYCIVQITGAQRAYRREIEEKNAQLAHYAITLEQLAITRERNRLARELHDTLAHTLSAVNVQLKALDVLIEQDPSAARHTLQQTQELTRSGLHEARRALTALRASPLEDLGLRLALERAAQQAAKRAGAALLLNLPSMPEGIAPEMEHSIYRVAEEALNNVVRHAGAKHISLSLLHTAGRLVLCIEDDGTGFDSSAPVSGRYGITGMRERAALIGATLDVNSAPGGGTAVRLTIDQLG